VRLWLTVVMKKLTALGDKILAIGENVLVYFSLVCLGVMASMVNADLVGRQFGFSVPYTIEISGYLLVPITYLPVALCLRQGLHVKVDFITRLLPSGARLIVLVATDLLTSLVSIVVLLGCWNLFLTSYSRGLVSNTMLRAPLSLPQSTIVIGLLVFVVEMFVTTWRSIIALQRKDSKEQK